jgi:D-serine dehydratase
MPTPEQILAEPLDASFKGFPTERAPFPVGAAAAQDLRLLRGDLPLPVAVLRESALRGNAAWFARFVAETGASLCPHGKTTLAPQLFAEQLRDGAWGITVANVHQALLAVASGAPRVLMANQLATVGDARRWAALAAATPGVRFLTLTDSTAQLDVLCRGAAAADAAPLEVMVELGTPGGRTGCRSVDEALAVARAVRAAPRARLVGVEAFEGLNVSGDSSRDAALVGDWMSALARLARRCAQEALFDCPDDGDGARPILSAGGSAAYDLVAVSLRASFDPPLHVVLRSGCYLSHDDGMYRRHAAAVAARGLVPATREGGLQGALEVWAAVQSRPEPDRAIVTLGRRDVGTDADLPVPLHWFRPGRDARPSAAPRHWTVFGHNDQHGYLRVDPADTVAVGDWVGFGVSHPCTTFDKWRLVWGVDDDYVVTRAIRTYF